MENKEKPRDRIAELLADDDAVTEAMSKSIREALMRHYKLGQDIVVTRDGRPVRVPAAEALGLPPL